MKKIYFGLLVSLFTTSVSAQSISLEWATSMGALSDDTGRSITIDSSGNVYITGYFEGTVDFDPNAGVSNLTAVGLDIYILKLDGTGNLVWVKSMGGVSGEYGTSITIDGSGNVYTTGTFGGTVDFDPGPGTYNLTAGGNGDTFILKLDAAGNFLWAKNIGGPAAPSTKGNGIIADDLGYIYLTGDFWGTADFDPNIGVSNMTAVGLVDIYVVKMNSNGSLIWAKSMGGISADTGRSITVDASGNVLTTGHFQDTVDFDPNAGITIISAVGSGDNYIQKLDPLGNLLWVKTMGGAGGSASGWSIVVDSIGNIHTTGKFGGTVDFDPGPGTLNLTSNGASDIYVQKLDIGGNLLWAKSIGGSDYDLGYSIALDGLGNVYTTGYFEGTADFDPGAGVLNTTAIGMSDIFILKLDSSGDLLWVETMGGLDGDWGYSLALDGTDYIYICGTFVGTSDFDPTVGIVNLTSNGGWDIFIEKFNQSTTNQIENSVFSDVSIFPNPSSAQVNIYLGELKELSINVYNVIGQLIFHEENIHDPIYQFELKGEPGLYLLELCSYGKKRQYKLVKE